MIDRSFSRNRLHALLNIGIYHQILLLNRLDFHSTLYLGTWHLSRIIDIYLLNKSLGGFLDSIDLSYQLVHRIVLVLNIIRLLFDQILVLEIDRLYNVRVLLMDDPRVPHLGSRWFGSVDILLSGVSCVTGLTSS